jgi:hypothetical protein
VASAFGSCYGLHTGLVVALHVVFTFGAESMHGCRAFLCGLSLGCPVSMLAHQVRPPDLPTRFALGSWHLVAQQRAWTHIKVCCLVYSTQTCDVSLCASFCCTVH